VTPVPEVVVVRALVDVRQREETGATLARLVVRQGAIQQGQFRPDVPVGQLHTLRVPRGPGGVQHRREVLERPVLAGQVRRVGRRRVRDVDHLVDDGRQFVGHVAGRLRHQHVRTTVLDDVRGLFRAERRIDRDQHDPGEVARDVDDAPLVPRLRLYREAVARVETERLQAASDLPCLLVKFGERHGLVLPAPLHEGGRPAGVFIGSPGEPGRKRFLRDGCRWSLSHVPFALSRGGSLCRHLACGKG